MSVRAEQIPIVLCVDVEPFRRQVEESPEPYWHGTPETFDRLDGWRPLLTGATGAPVHFSWFWRADPQIEETYGSVDWGFVRYRAVLEAAVARGDEHGVHPHLFRRESSGPWITDARDRRWIAHCVGLSLGAFEPHLGHACRLVRLGDRRMDTPTARLLNRLGLDVDLTVEPGVPAEHEEESNGPTPDYTRARSRPYRPARSNFLRARRLGLGRRGLVMLPLTTSSPAPDGGRRVFRPWDEPEVTTAAVDALLDEGQRYLAFAIRTNVVVSPTAWANLEGLLTHLVGHPLAHRFVFATPSQAVGMLADARAMRGEPALPERGRARHRSGR
ncbi:MAG: hypothetical protein ACRDY6_00165 [Acidimicrobiia bacterium]